jgi:hypothetical protein
MVTSPSTRVTAFTGRGGVNVPATVFIVGVVEAVVKQISKAWRKRQKPLICEH